MSNRTGPFVTWGPLASLVLALVAGAGLTACSGPTAPVDVRRNLLQAEGTIRYEGDPVADAPVSLGFRVFVGYRDFAEQWEDVRLVQRQSAADGSYLVETSVPDSICRIQNLLVRAQRDGFWRGAPVRCGRNEVDLDLGCTDADLGSFLFLVRCAIGAVTGTVTVNGQPPEYVLPDSSHSAWVRVGGDSIVVPDDGGYRIEYQFPSRACSEHYAVAGIRRGSDYDVIPRDTVVLDACGEHLDVDFALVMK